jgi:hypothetical protein
MLKLKERKSETWICCVFFEFVQIERERDERERERER